MKGIAGTEVNNTNGSRFGTEGRERFIQIS